MIIGVHAYRRQEEGLLTLRDSMPMYVAAFVGAVWVYRSFEQFRPPDRVGGHPRAAGDQPVHRLAGMETYPFQSMEQAFVRSISTGESQEGQPPAAASPSASAPEAQMAQYIKQNVRGKNAILTDNAQTFGVILLSGRPQQFLDRIDRGDSAFNDILTDPDGLVEFMLHEPQPAQRRPDHRRAIRTPTPGPRRA